MSSVETLDAGQSEMVRRLFAHLEAAAHAGTLLKIEDAIQTVVQDAYRAHGELFRDSDEERWRGAERKLLAALRSYADRAEDGKGYERRLFAEDALRGLGFIDACRIRYDVALMNPPFGDPPSKAAEWMAPIDCGNLYAAFVRRSTELGASFIGCISDRTFVTQASFKKYRNELLQKPRQLSALLDLGWEVLDANVQVAAYVVADSGGGACACLDLRNEAEAKPVLSRAASGAWSWTPIDVFRRLPDLVLAYSLPTVIVRAVEGLPALGDIAELPRGLGSNKAARTYLFWAEISLSDGNEQGRWRPLANGGDYAPYWRQDLGVADWLTPRGWPWVEMTALDAWRPYDQSGTESYFRCGLSFPKQSSSFNVALLPEGYLPTREGKAILPKNSKDSLLLLAYLNSRAVRAFVRDTCGLHKQSGAISRIPIPNFSPVDRGRA